MSAAIARDNSIRESVESAVHLTQFLLCWLLLAAVLLCGLAAVADPKSRTARWTLMRTQPRAIAVILLVSWFALAVLRVGGAY